MDLKKLISQLGLYSESNIVVNFGDFSNVHLLINLLAYFESDKILAHINLFKYDPSLHYDSLKSVLTSPNLKVTSISTYNQIYYSEDHLSVRNLNFSDHKYFTLILTKACEYKSVEFLDGIIDVSPTYEDME